MTKYRIAGYIFGGKIIHIKISTEVVYYKVNLEIILNSNCMYTNNRMCIWRKMITLNKSFLAQWVVRLTRNRSVVSSNHINGSPCFLEHETLPLLLSTGWFQELIQVWFHNETKISWGPYNKLVHSFNVIKSKCHTDGFKRSMFTCLFCSRLGFHSTSMTAKCTQI